MESQLSSMRDQSDSMFLQQYAAYEQLGLMLEQLRQSERSTDLLQAQLSPQLGFIEMEVSRTHSTILTQ